MHTMQPTLLVGPSDWEAARMPKDEFLTRATALWRTARAASGAIVYGDHAHHAELAYLTSFTPKLEAALALIPRVGSPRLFVGGGANMIQAAKPLTFIESVQPLRDIGATVAQWAREQSGGGRPVLIAPGQLDLAPQRLGPGQERQPVVTLGQLDGRVELPGGGVKLAAEQADPAQHGQHPGCVSRLRTVLFPPKLE